MRTASESTLNREEIAIHFANATIKGILTIPAQAKSLIIFAHGAGSSRLSPRNNRVADFLNQNNLATLLMDLLTEPEERTDLVTGQLRFDINFLAKRLDGVTQWILENRSTKELSLGYFGSSTGAAAALKAAAHRPEAVKALVSRGGRPDMAQDVLPQVRTPTLLIVGSDDTHVLELNRMAFDMLSGEKDLVIVPGATHLFEEPGKLDEVAEHAKRWFVKYLS